jgi:hypothetical protein
MTQGNAFGVDLGFIRDRAAVTAAGNLHEPLRFAGTRISVITVAAAHAAYAVVKTHSGA